MLNLQIPSPLQEIKEPLLEEKGLRLFIKREDLIHPIVSGNKWRKLKYNLLHAKEKGHNTILSFGGAYSNHIHALAGAAKEMNFKSIGIIRGEEILPLNSTLSFARDCGMKLHFVSREEYKNKKEEFFIEKLKRQFGEFYLIPEGGSNEEGVKGCMEIIGEIETPFDIICCACGTGTTLAGIITSLASDKKAMGFSALKGGEFLFEEVKELLLEKKNSENNNWSIEAKYHFGGYGKWDARLMEFINDFYSKHKIPLDQVYTGKMMFGIYDKIKNDFFEKGTTILAIHTGGLQGLPEKNKSK